LDKLVPKSKEDDGSANKFADKEQDQRKKSRSVKTAPMVACHNQKMRRRMEEDYRRLLMATERRQKTERFNYFKKHGVYPKKTDEDRNV